MILKIVRRSFLCTQALPVPSTASFTRRYLKNMPAYLNQKDAQQLDVDLMSDEGGFKLEQVAYKGLVLAH